MVQLKLVHQCILFTVVYFVANALYHAKHLNCGVNSRHLELILESAETHATLFMRPHLLTHCSIMCFLSYMELRKTAMNS